VVLDVYVPADLSKDQRELARRLDEALGPASSRGGDGGWRSRRRARARRGR
jgi:hypothetical protein